MSSKIRNQITATTDDDDEKKESFPYIAVDEMFGERQAIERAHT